MEQAYPTIPGYDVLALVGAGATARVWRARRLADDRLLAVKVLPVAGGQVSAALREASVLSRVRHEHLIHLYDVVPLPGPDGRPAAVALAMQLAEGGSLAELLAGRGHLSAGEVVTVAAPLAAALADLHRSGVVHGDVSPGNVLFLGDGMPMLGDLGVCRIAGERVESVHGTDGMVAPELLEGFAPAAESDVYALGAVAWTCLTGQVPGWVGTRESLAELAPEIPEALRDLVLTCLEPEPADRPDADEVAARIFEAVTPEPVELGPGADPAAGLTQRIRRAAAVDAFALGAGEGEEEPDDSRAARRARRRPARSAARRRVLVGGLVALVLLPLLVLGVRWATGWVLEAPTSVAGTTATQDPVTTPHPATTGTPTTGTAPTGSTPGSAAAPEGTGNPGSTTGPEGEVAEDLQDLLDARAAAWHAGDPDLLGAVHVPDSAAWEADSSDLGEAQGRGLAYRGLTFTATDVDIVESDEDHRVVTTRVQRSAYTVVGEGQEWAHPGTEDEVTFELGRTDQGWRIVSWTLP